MSTASIVWRRIDVGGHDACRIEKLDNGWKLTGTAVFIEDSVPSNIRYDVRHGSDWSTQAAYISGWVGEASLDLEIAREANGQWLYNGEEVGNVRGSVDIDLGFTPATNTT